MAISFWPAMSTPTTCLVKSRDFCLFHPIFLIKNMEMSTAITLHYCHKVAYRFCTRVASWMRMGNFPAQLQYHYDVRTLKLTRNPQVYHFP